MIKPSGYPQSLLAIDLIYHTNNTKILWNGETADITCPCPRMLMAAGFNTENALWRDSHSLKENHPFSPANSSQSVLKSHQLWDSKIRANTNSKVELVFGKPVEVATKFQFQGLLEQIVLWDDLKTEIFIRFTKPSKAAIDRIFVFAPHQQSFLIIIT
jgi:hypothetical protein